MADDNRNVEQFMKDVVNAATDEGFKDYSNGKTPSPEEVWSLIEQMDGLSRAERNQLYTSLFNTSSTNQMITGRSTAEYTVFLAMIAVIIVVFDDIYHIWMEMQYKRQILNADYQWLVEQLKRSLDAIVSKTGSSRFSQRLIDKIKQYQNNIKEGNNDETTSKLIDDITKSSVLVNLDEIEQKLHQYEQFENVYNYSILMGTIFIILVTCGLFGYKLYKSLNERELKRKEKRKQKQKNSKKSKKSN